MRTISKNAPPPKLVEWQAKCKDDINYGYALMRQDEDVVEAVVLALLEEQGWLCAYTGRPINETTCHIEHMRPQKYTPKGQRPPDVSKGEVEAYRGEDVNYLNMVACYPEPNRSGKVPYGAEAKGSWPPPGDEGEFVRPTQTGCESRFQFDRRGRVSTVAGPARKTCRALRLCDKELTRLRRAAVEGARNPTGKSYLTKRQLQTVLGKLESETGRLTPYTFAVQDGLAECIRRASR